jgi:hypothetical protein
MRIFMVIFAEITDSVWREAKTGRLRGGRWRLEIQSWWEALEES